MAAELAEDGHDAIEEAAHRTERASAAVIGEEHRARHREELSPLDPDVLARDGIRPRDEPVEALPEGRPVWVGLATEASDGGARGGEVAAERTVKRAQRACQRVRGDPAGAASRVATASP